MNSGWCLGLSLFIREFARGHIALSVITQLLIFVPHLLNAFLCVILVTQSSAVLLLDPCFHATTSATSF
jgi:hypothetical protein